MAITASKVDLTVMDSGDFYDAFQFGTEGDTSWNFDNKTFEMEIKGSRDDDDPLLELNTGNGRIVVDSGGDRVLHLYVSKADWQAALVPGCYVYDLIMVDDITTVRTPLMYGSIEDKRGVSQT